MAQRNSTIRLLRMPYSPTCRHPCVQQRTRSRLTHSLAPPFLPARWQSFQRRIGLLSSCTHYHINILGKSNTCRRSFVSSGKPSNGTIDPVVSQYLAEHVRVDLPELQQTEFHKRILQALQPVYGKEITVAHLQSFGVEGLEALALSIQKEILAQQGENSKYVTVHFAIPHHHSDFNLKWYNYETEPLLSVAERTSEGIQLLSEYIERACSGNAMCCTCHVYVEKEDNDAAALELTKKGTAEKDMLDLAFEPKKNSRLACQLRLLKVPEEKVNSDEPALTVTIPSGVNNMF